MRLIVLALLLSARPIAIGQSSPSPSQAPNPDPCNSALKLISPDACVHSASTAISILPIAPPSLNRTGRALPLVQPAIPSQLLVRNINPVQFLALNQPAPQVAPKASLHGKTEPIPTTFPDAHFQNIPTNWPGLKFMLIDQPPPTSAAGQKKK
jgi:hypothetical protein